MLPFDTLATPGVHPFFFETPSERLEAILNVPASPQPQLAILGHPHSLHGGSMQNKVVTTLVRAFADLQIPSIRFNFRGVGKSSGAYDAGIGESEDMALLAKIWKDHRPDDVLILAGFSFGSFVAYRAAQTVSPKLLITIAPPVHHFDYKSRLGIGQPAPFNWHIIQGTEDDIVPYDVVMAFASSFRPALPVVAFDATGHFFHGKLVELKESVITIAQDCV